MIPKKKFNIGQEVTLDDINKIRNFLYSEAFERVKGNHKQYNKEHKQILKSVKFIVKDIPNIIKNKGVTEYK